MVIFKQAEALHAIHSFFLCNFNEVNNQSISTASDQSCLLGNVHRMNMRQTLATVLIQLSIPKCYWKQQFMCATCEIAVCGTIFIFIWTTFIVLVEIYCIQHVKCNMLFLEIRRWCLWVNICRYMTHLCVASSCLHWDQNSDVRNVQHILYNTNTQYSVVFTFIHSKALIKQHDINNNNSCWESHIRH